jgi:hypothetical protein
MQSPNTLQAPLFAMISTCCLKDNFWSKKIPSHWSVFWATMVSVHPNVLVMVMGGDGSFFPFGEVH